MSIWMFTFKFVGKPKTNIDLPFARRMWSTACEQEADARLELHRHWYVEFGTTTVTKERIKL